MPSPRTPIHFLAATILVALFASVAAAMVATSPAPAQIQDFVCEQGELVGDQCRIVGPAPECLSPAQGTPPNCYEVVPSSPACVSPYVLTDGQCVYIATDSLPWFPVNSAADCPPTGGPTPTPFGRPPATVAAFPHRGCTHPPQPVCPAGATLVGSQCRVPVAPACPDPFDLDGGRCIRFVPADVIVIPGKVTVTYGAECGPDGRVGLVNIQIATENGATVAAITINGSPNTSTRVDPGGPINVGVITNEPSDEVVIRGPTNAPSCAAPTPTPRPTTPPTTPTPTPTVTPTATPTPNEVPVLAASVTPGECVAEAERSVVMAASLSPASATGLVRWRVDGAPVGGPETPGTLNITVDAGGPLEFEAEVLDPADVAPFSETVEIEPCEAPGESLVEVGACDAAGLTNAVVVEPCERVLTVDAQVGKCVAEGRQVVIKVTIEPSIVGDLIQLRVDGDDVGPPAPAGTRTIVVADDGADHTASAELVEPATGETAATTFTVDPCPQDPVSISATTLRQHGRSQIVLPAECASAEVELLGIDALVPVQLDDQQRAIFTTDSTTLPVGEHVATIDCSGTPVEVTIFVYHQIGGSRGEARGVTVASGLGLAGAALIGGARRRLL